MCDPQVHPQRPLSATERAKVRLLEILERTVKYVVGCLDSSANLGVQSGRAPTGGAVMADVVYVAVTVVFFWLSWQLVKLCERL